jgi:hypothetical protein
LLSLEGFSPVEGVRRDSAGLAFVSPGLGFEALESALLADPFPAGESAGADGATGGVRDVVVSDGDLLAQLAFAARWVLAADEGQDEGVTKESDLGTSVFRHSSASWTS